MAATAAMPCIVYCHFFSCSVSRVMKYACMGRWHEGQGHQREKLGGGGGAGKVVQLMTCDCALPVHCQWREWQGYQEGGGGQGVVFVMSHFCMETVRGGEGAGSRWEEGRVQSRQAELCTYRCACVVAVMRAWLGQRG